MIGSLLINVAWSGSPFSIWSKTAMMICCSHARASTAFASTPPQAAPMLAHYLKSASSSARFSSWLGAPPLVVDNRFPKDVSHNVGRHPQIDGVQHVDAKALESEP